MPEWEGLAVWEMKTGLCWDLSSGVSTFPSIVYLA